MIRKAAPLMVALGLSFAAASAVQAAPPAVCSTFKQSNVSISFETIGHKWTCSAAKAWVVKLAKDKIPATGFRVTLKNGPGGYHCYALPDKLQLAINGQCFTGSAAFPGTGFAWLQK